MFVEDHAQTAPVKAKLGYLQSVYQHKQQFVGKPFSVLLDSLKVPIRYFVPTGTHTYDISKETNSTFYFFVPKANESSMRNIMIYWQTPLNATVSDQIFTNSEGWNSEPKEFYKNGIIDDILVSRDIESYSSNAVPPRWIVVSCVYKKVLVDGLYQWRYVVTKKYCDNGNLGKETQVAYSTAKVAVETCTSVVD